MEKVSKTYDPVSLARILQSLERRIESLQQSKLRRIKSVAAEAAQNLAVNEVGYVLSDTGQNFDLVVRCEDGRLYRITGAASSSGGSSGSGGTTDHGSLSGLGDDDHTQYHNDTRGDVRYPLKSLLTTKGDLFVRDASVVNRLGVGTDGYILTADSTQALGVKWAASAPVGSSYVVISLDGTLTNERNLAITGGLTLTDGGANAAVTLGLPSPFTSGNVLSANGSAFVSLTPDAAGLVDKSSTQTGIAGNKTFTGATTFQTAVDSTTGFQILDADGGNPVICIDTLNERIGIGTAAPAFDMHIEKSVNGIVGFKVTNTSTAANAFSGLFFNNDTGAGVNIAVYGTGYTPIPAYANRVVFDFGGAINGILFNASDDFSFCNITTGVPNLIIKNTTGRVGIGNAIDTTPDSVVHIAEQSALTNTIQYLLRFEHSTSGTAAIGLGVGIVYLQEVASGTIKTMGDEAMVWNNASGSEAADFTIRLVDNTAENGSLQEKLRISSLAKLTLSRRSSSTNRNLFSITPSFVVSTDATFTGRVIFNVHDYGGAREVLRIEASGSAGMFGAFGVAAVVRPTAYTQTYSTATKTHAARTAVTLTDNSAGTANTTVEALPDPADTPLTADALRDDIVTNLLPALRNNFADIVAQINALKTDIDNTAQFANQMCDDHQALGWLQ